MLSDTLGSLTKETQKGFFIVCHFAHGVNNSLYIQLLCALGKSTKCMYCQKANSNTNLENYIDKYSQKFLQASIRNI